MPSPCIMVAERNPKQPTANTHTHTHAQQPMIAQLAGVGAQTTPVADEGPPPPAEAPAKSACTRYHLLCTESACARGITFLCTENGAFAHPNLFSAYFLFFSAYYCVFFAYILRIFPNICAQTAQSHVVREFGYGPMRTGAPVTRKRTALQHTPSSDPCDTQRN